MEDFLNSLGSVDSFESTEIYAAASQERETFVWPMGDEEEIPVLDDVRDFPPELLHPNVPHSSKTEHILKLGRVFLIPNDTMMRLHHSRSQVDIRLRRLSQHISKTLGIKDRDANLETPHFMILHSNITDVD